MSAYIVDRNHIGYLVGAAVAWRRSMSIPLKYGDAMDSGDYRAIGDDLWQENIKSVSARYPGEDASMLPGPCDETYLFSEMDIHYDHFNPVQVIKACQCYQYQSSEHDGWESSAAHALTESLISCAIGKLPGYDAAEWGAPERKSETISIMSLARGRK